MAKRLYEIKLNESYCIASTPEEATDIYCQGRFGSWSEEDVKVSVKMQEEHTMKLMVLAKTLYDTEKFEPTEVRSLVYSLAYSLGYQGTAEEVTECILTWVERFDDMTLAELEEWLTV